MSETRPTGEQLRFVSANTGEHILDTYLEAAEKGGRTLADMLADIYDPSTGLFRSDYFEFRITSARQFQVRVGDFPDTSTGWTDVASNPSLFAAKGAWAATTAYVQTDLVTYNNSTYYCLVPHTSTSTFNAANWAVMTDASALNAATTTAQTSATAAANSATAAATSATTATTKAAEAVTSATAAASSATTASTHATTATTKATEANASASGAATSSSNATASATAASSSATTASTKAAEASNSASSASNSAATATTQATLATSKAADAINAASNASADAATALTRMVGAETAANASAASAAAALASEQGANTAYANAVNSASASAAGAATSTAKASEAAGSAAAINATFGNAASVAALAQNAQAAASLAQGYAASASSVVQQDLSGVTAQALHRSPNAITAMFVYDTSKDSDGGAWTKKCQQTSWYNEALAGKWLGPQDTEFQARNAGSTISATELVTNGTFDTDVSGWLTAGCTVSKSGNAMRITDSDGSTGYAYRSVTLEIGKTYLASVRVTLDAITGSLTLYMGTSSGSNQMGSSSLANGPGTISFYFTATATTGWIAIRNITAIAGEYWEVDNVSVREVTALNTASNDYFQLTTDGKFYRLWKNLVSQSEFANGVTDAPIRGGLLTATTFSGLSGTTGLSYDYNGTTEAYAYKQSAAIAGTTQTFSIHVRMTDGNAPVFGSATTTNSANDFVIVIAGVVITPTTYNVANLGGGLYRVSATATTASTIAVNNTGVLKYVQNSNRTFTTSGWQLETGSVATTYEPKTTLGSTSEIFRGNKAEFPKLAAIVAETANVNIYDLTEPGRPMWMRFLSSAANNTTTTRAILGANTQSSVAALNGILATGSTANGGYQGSLVNFPADAVPYLTNGITGSFRGDIARRNDQLGFNLVGGFGTIVSTSINAIAMTVLPDAPMDPATGLRVPTIAVATGGGVSVIKHNGTVVNSSNTTAANAVVLSPNLLEWGIDSSNRIINWSLAKNPGSLGASFAGTGSNWWKAFSDNGTSYYSRKISPVGRIRGRLSTVSDYGAVALNLHNTDTSAKGLGVGITNTFNTGWMTGDIRRAYLSDVTAEAVAANIQNEDFSSYADNAALRAVWSSGTPADISLVGGKMQIAVASTWVARSWPTVIGRVYRISITVASGVSPTIRLGSSVSGTNYGQFTATPVGTVRLSFLATGTNFWASAYASPTLAHEFSSFVLEEVVADRSYKAQSASINGTLTKAQLASGTSLVGYSGFSASNYLREPYSADLDFGTGEFTASAWVNIPSSALNSSHPTYGPDLVAGALSSSTGWTGLSADCTVSGGTLTKTGGTTHYPYYAFPTALSQGDVILVKFDVVATNGSIGIRIGHAPGWNFGDYPSAPGTYYRLFTNFYAGSGNGIGFDFGGAITGTIQNLSVYRVKPFAIASRSHSSGPSIELSALGANYIRAVASDGVTTRTVTYPALTGLNVNPVIQKDTWLKARVRYTTDGSLAITVNGREVAATRGTPLASMTLGKNMISQSESFDLAPWNNSAGGTGVACVVTSNAGNDPNGNPAADRIQFNLGGGTVAADFTRRIQAVNTPATAHVFSIYVKSYDGTSTYSMHIVGPTGATTAIAVTGSWQRFEVTGTGPGSNLSYAIGLRGGQTPTNDNTADVLVWGAQVETGSTATAYAATNVAPLTIGNNFALDAPFPGSIALLKLGATVPTPEQDQFIYEQEKQLFRAGAQSVLPDSGAVLDMAYDDATDRWVAVSGTNESYWTGLVRNSVTPVPAGTYTRIVANSGVELNSRITTNPGVDVSIPAYGLREELVRRAEAASRLGKELATYDYVGGFTGNITTGSTAIASVAGLTYPTSYIGARISGTGIPTNATVVAVSGTTIYISAAATATTSTLSITFLDFILPAGMEAKTVFNAGVQTREGTTGATFSRLYDGFVETIRFGAAPGATALVTIQAQRITS